MTSPVTMKRDALPDTAKDIQCILPIILRERYAKLKHKHEAALQPEYIQMK